ncbi:FISUMP domain-containing protein [Psychroserpens sp.]|uniref:FISUMP domain-containing protein n=1 Tax=Psychroserpens sp. TaxID=2020870 RepID=UPI00385FF6C4
MKYQKTLLVASFIIFSSFIVNEYVATNETNYYSDVRDGNRYKIVKLNNLFWFQENLRYRTNSKKDTLISENNCGVFYLYEDIKKACPNGWRLPTEKEVKDLIKAEKKGKINILDTLNVQLCGRIDYEKHSKIGIQNTFWLNEDLIDNHVKHWHAFSTENKTHSHNVINARRKFPIRCVCEKK